jgi:hypothetical protein
MGPQREFYDYGVYGLSLRSEIRLGLPEHPAGPLPDVTLSFANRDWFAQATAGLPRDERTDGWYERVCCADGSEFLRWPDLFEFMITHNGRSVVWGFLERATVESFQTYLLAPVLSFALVKQGYEPLHATTVVIDGRAVAILGDGGQGKSTLAAAFVQAGHQILTDDLLLIRDVGGILYGFPGPPRIKLFPDVARRFFPDQAPCSLMNPETEKLIVPLEQGQWHTGPAPLHGFLLLREPDEPVHGSHLTRLSGTHSLLGLVRSTFNARIANPDRLRRQFLAAREWAARIPVRCLTYPKTLAVLEQVRQAIVSDVRSAGRAPS